MSQEQTKRRGGGGGDDDDALALGVLHRVVHRLGVVGAAEGHQDDVGAVVGRPDHAGDGVGVPAGAVGAQDLHRGDAGPGVGDAGDALAVVDARGGDAGHGGAVAVGVAVRVAAVQEAPAPGHAAGEVGVRAIDAGVEHGDPGVAEVGEVERCEPGPYRVGRGENDARGLAELRHGLGQLRPASPARAGNVCLAVGEARSDIEHRGVTGIDQCLQLLRRDLRRCDGLEPEHRLHRAAALDRP